MNIPSIEELDRVGYEAAGWPGRVPRQFDKEVESYVAAIRDAVVAACKPQLRPIAETPDEVPEGCVRSFWGKVSGFWTYTPIQRPCATHVIDIALPSELYPADFEAAFAESKLDAKDKDAAFKLWKGGER